MRLAVRSSVWLVLVAAAACGSAPKGPYFGDERFLVLGVSPEEEANKVSQELAIDGRAEYLRLRGATFTALGVSDPDGRPAWVRVITQRGIELALDPSTGHALSRGQRYELIAPAREGMYDADGDGFDEVIVLQRSYDEDDPCLLAYRLQNSGFVDLITDEAHAREVAREAVHDVEPCGSPSEPHAEGGEPPAEPAQ